MPEFRSRARLAGRALALLLPLIAHAAFAAAPSRPASLAPTHARRIDVIDVLRSVDVNNVEMQVTNFGCWGYDVAFGSPGFYYPKGSGNSAIFTAGPWIGAKVSGGIRLAISEYSQEFFPGGMAGGTYDDYSRPEHTVYKVARFTGDPAETTHVLRDSLSLATDPHLDSLAHHAWSEYMAGAVPFGAPTRTWRLPNTATPDPTDSVNVLGPDVLGDQMLWCVYNDANQANHTNVAGSTQPLGVEVQQTTFAYAQVGALSNTVFMKYRIVNKGVNVLDSVFVGMWLDADLGGGNDDLLGCDPARNLGYIYNGTNNDLLYGSSPPALGVDLVLGPRQSGTGTSHGMTSFQGYVNGNDPSTSGQSWRALKGFNPQTGARPIDPTTSQPTPYMYSGDPLTASGWLDAVALDKRMLLASGPFHLVPGDTVQCLIAVIVGQGGDRLASIAALRANDDVVQAVADASLQSTAVMLALAAVDATPERVRLSWFASDGAGVRATVWRRATAQDWQTLATIEGDGAGHLAFEDRDVVAGTHYDYRLGVMEDGRDVYAGEASVDVPDAPTLALERVRPNPAVAELAIAFTLADAAPATLSLTDIAGRRVWSAAVGAQGPGRHVVRVDGARLAPGVYVVTLEGSGRRLTRSACIVR